MNEIGLNPGILKSLFSTNGTDKKIFHAIDRLMPDTGDKEKPSELQGSQFLSLYSYKAELSVSLSQTYQTRVGDSAFLLDVQRDFSASITNTWLASSANLTLTDLDDGSAKAVALQTNQELSLSTLSITRDTSISLLKAL